MHIVETIIHVLLFFVRIVKITAVPCLSLDQKPVRVEGFYTINLRHICKGCMSGCHTMTTECDDLVILFAPGRLFQVVGLYLSGITQLFQFMNEVTFTMFMRFKTLVYILWNQEALDVCQISLFQVIQPLDIVHQDKIGFVD